MSGSTGAGTLAVCWGAKCTACKCRVNAASELQGLNGGWNPQEGKN